MAPQAPRLFHSSPMKGGLALDRPQPVLIHEKRTSCVSKIRPTMKS
jgi:hypothetical protein